MNWQLIDFSHISGATCLFMALLAVGVFFNYQVGLSAVPCILVRWSRPFADQGKVTSPGISPFQHSVPVSPHVVGTVIRWRLRGSTLSRRRRRIFGLDGCPAGMATPNWKAPLSALYKGAYGKGQYAAGRPFIYPRALRRHGQVGVFSVSLMHFLRL